MVNQSFLINNINAVKDNFSVNAKVVRLWKQHYYGGDTLASMDMILMDEEGSRISAHINNKMVSLFDSVLKEGGSYNLSSFYVVKNNAPYKVSNHPFKINFHRKTKVKSIQSVFGSKYGFSFVPFTDFLEDNVKEDQIVDVIGHVSAVGDVVHGERKGKKNRRMVVELTDPEGLKLKCTIWDSFIDFFYTKMESSPDHIKVFAFQFGTVRKYRDSVSVSNTFYSSRFFINEDIPEIAEFRTRLIARVGDDTSSLQVSNLTSESSESSGEKSFFHGTKYVNLEQLIDVFEPCACVTVATITSVEYEEGWYYIACCGCNCKAVPNDNESSSKTDDSNIKIASKRKIRNTYRCETCGPDVVDVIPKFRVQVRVCDDTACASFLMFDRDVFSIVGRSAYALKEEEAANPDAPEYPGDLNDLLGKTLLMRVDVSRYNLINNYAVYTVGRMSKSEMHIEAFRKLYDIEMEEEKAVNEDDDGPDGGNEAPVIKTNETSKLDSANSSKDVESSTADNVAEIMVKAEPVEFHSTPPQAKRVIVDLEKDKGAPSVSSRNKKRVVLKNKDK